MKLNVNTDAAIQLTAKLEKLHRSAFPSAVRNTLNDMAFEAKKQIPIEAKDQFTIRQKNLFNRFSIVEKASGFNVSSMVSKVGIDANVNRGNEVSKGLEKQEKGGSIVGSKLIPHNKGRLSGSYQKKMPKKRWLANIDIGTQKKKVVSAKYVLIKSQSKGTVFEINNNKKLTPVFTYVKSRNKSIQKRQFIQPAVKTATSKAEMFYKNNAEFQFKKHLK